MRETSLETFDNIRESLGEMQQIVYDTIVKLGCPTDLEIMRYLGYSDPNRVRPRRNDLVKMGIIVECEKRICSVSQRTSYSWRVKSE